MTSSTGAGGVTCLLTIHGIGFQQAPHDDAGVPGYADQLHADLHRLLPELLSDDPHRAQPLPGERGAIYVQSSWPPDQSHPEVRSVELGLSRLGPARNRAPSTVSGGIDAPLAPPGHVAHVALIYTSCEETAPDRMSLLETAATGLFALEHYITLKGAITLGRGVFSSPPPPPHPAAPGAGAGKPEGRPSRTGGNVPRDDMPHRRGSVQRLVEHVQGPQAAAATTPLAVLRTVEDDVAAYVVRNKQREGVRDFVRAAITRLAERDDVTGIVVNAHSQGTVVAFDVLRSLSDAVISKVAALVTLGSPLRKYALVLDWGPDIGQVAQVRTWINMWDAMDPVADPMRPAASWRRGDCDPDAAEAGLFLDVAADSGIGTPSSVTDIRVDNVSNTQSAGLRAHDYWSNTDEVVSRLSDTLRRLAAGQPLSAGDVQNADGRDLAASGALVGNVPDHR